MRRSVALSLPSFQEAQTLGRPDDFGGSMWDATGRPGLITQETEDSWALHAV
jgi:hypothetical protein